MFLSALDAKPPHQLADVALEAVADEACRIATDLGNDDPAALDEFARFLAQKVATSGALGQAVSLHLGDLGIAWGVSRNDARAVASLASILRKLDASIARIGASPELIEEIKQAMASSLVLPRPGRPPEILDYSGRGPMAAWLRVIAVRRARRLVQRERQNAPADDERLIEHLATSGRFDIDYAKAAHRDAISAALRDALSDLQPRQRTLLRYQIIDHIGVTEIGAIYAVHRATAARWAAEARDALLEALRRRVTERLRVTDDEVDTLVRLVGSQVEVSLARLLDND
jgi:RNA polymerase sigma-70 factor (ECF subfamily)